MTTTIANARSTAARLGWRLPTRDRDAGGSTTRRTLLRLDAALLLLTVTAFLTTLLAFTYVHRTAKTVSARTAPAIINLITARGAFLRADSAAISSFSTGGGPLAGPGTDFQNQLTIAGQSLTRAAETNTAGESQAIQVIDELMTTYTAEIGQADAHYRSTGGAALGAAYLWYASSVLNRDDGIVGQLDTLLGEQKGALDNEIATSAVAPRAVLVNLPLAGLCALLVATQITLRRRFHRTVNPWLVLATALVPAMLAISATDVAAQSHLHNTRNTLQQLTDPQQQTSGPAAESQRQLQHLVTTTACGSVRVCRGTVAQSNPYRGHPASETIDSGRLVAEIQDVNEQTAAAGAADGLQWLIYVLGALIAASVLLGLRPRLNEYRYRSR